MERPRSWIDLDDCEIVRINDPSHPMTKENLSALTKITASVSIKVHLVELENRPPWRNDDFVTLLESQHKRQFIIVAETVTAFALATIALSMEKGYDTFFVCCRISDCGQDDILRLQKTGAKLLAFSHFVEECKLG